MLMIAAVLIFCDKTVLNKKYANKQNSKVW